MGKKTLTGVVISTKMNGSIVVEVTRRTPHAKYKKLIKRSKKYVVGTGDVEAAVGDMVKIIETRPMSANKHFIVAEKVK